MSDRLDAFLSRRGFGSRSEVRALIRAGRVTVAAVPCRDQARQLRGDAVCVDGVVIAVGVSAATLLLNKPLGHACSHDPAEAPLIEELIPAAYHHLALEPAGRLDRDTGGLLVLTSQGALIHALTNPRRHLAKRYRILYSGTLTSHAVARCAKGMLLDGDTKPTLPAELILEPSAPAGHSRATLILHEGRYHQVRRMVAALGGEVQALVRDRIGGLDLPGDLVPGMMREISAAEHALLLQDAAGDRAPALRPSQDASGSAAPAP
jgi:16S rRNA pseudouridine516 synthase